MHQVSTTPDRGLAELSVCVGGHTTRRLPRGIGPYTTALASALHTAGAAVHVVTGVRTTPSGGCRTSDINADCAGRSSSTASGCLGVGTRSPPGPVSSAGRSWSSRSSPRARWQPPSIGRTWLSPSPPPPGLRHRVWSRCPVDRARSRCVPQEVGEPPRTVGAATRPTRQARDDPRRRRAST